MKNAFLLEKVNLSQVAPQSIVAAVNGQRIAMKGGDRLAIAILLGTSAASTVEITLKQHNAASGGTTKNLSVANKYFHKVAPATTFTQVEPSSAAAVYTLTSLFSTAAGVAVFEVLAEDLDVNNNFAWVSVDFTAAGVAKNAAVLHVLHECPELPAYGIAMA